MRKAENGLDVRRQEEQDGCERILARTEARRTGCLPLCSDTQPSDDAAKGARIRHDISHEIEIRGA